MFSNFGINLERILSDFIENPSNSLDILGSRMYMCICGMIHQVVVRSCLSRSVQHFTYKYTEGGITALNSIDSSEKLKTIWLICVLFPRLAFL